MKLEDFRNRQPLTIPDGYFDKVSDDIMNRLPCKESKRHTLHITRWNRYLNYAAIALIAFLIGQAVYTNSFDTESVADFATTEDNYNNEYIDEMLNSYPIDEYTFYCCLTGNDINY